VNDHENLNNIFNKKKNKIADGTLILAWQQRPLSSTPLSSSASSSSTSSSSSSSSSTSDANTNISTCIGLYSANSVQRVYRNEAALSIVSCSINADVSLVAFVTHGHATSNDGVMIYESFLAELRSDKQLVPLKVQSRELQSVQFVTNGKGSHLLLAVARTYVHLYQIYHRTVRPGDAKITAQPALRQIVARSPLWFAWDVRNAMLAFVVAQPKTPARKKEPTASCVLHLVYFTERARNASYPLDLDFAVDDNVTATATTTTTTTTTTATATTATESSEPILSLVHLPDHGLCLCAQRHEPIGANGAPPRVVVTLYVLHHRYRYTFPLVLPPSSGCKQAPTAPAAAAAASRGGTLSIGVASNAVQFDRLLPLALIAPVNDCVSIYAPGIALRLFDCGREHESCQSLMLDDANFVPSLPCGGSPVAFDALLSTAVLDSRAPRATCFCPSCGVCYEYAFEPHTLLALCDESRGDVHRQALHFALVHLRNRDLADDIVTHLCESKPQWVTPSLLSEYLLSAAYEQARSSGIAPPILDLLPVTALPRLTADYVRANESHLGELECAPLAGFTFDSGSNRKWYLEQRRFELTSLHTGSSVSGGDASSAAAAAAGASAIGSPAHSATWNPAADGDASGWNNAVMSATMPSLMAFSPPQASMRSSSSTSRMSRFQTVGKTQSFRHSPTGVLNSTPPHAAAVSSSSSSTSLTQSGSLPSPHAEPSSSPVLMRSMTNVPTSSSSSLLSGARGGRLSVSADPRDDSVVADNSGTHNNDDNASTVSSGAHSSGNTSSSNAGGGGAGDGVGAVSSATNSPRSSTALPVAASVTPTHSAAVASTSSSPSPSSATTMRRFFFGLFGIEQLASPKRVEESEHDDLPQTLDVVPRTKIIQVLAQHLIAALGRHSSKDKCTAAARSYLASCMTASTGLIAAVHRGNDRNSESEYLRQLECVYLSLDRLALPCALDLRYDMSDLGWRCLPTSLFIQYVERDIFLLTDDLINNMLESLDTDATAAAQDDDDDTARIRAYLMTRLSNPTLCARYLRKTCAPTTDLLEYHLRSAALNSASLITSLEHRDLECGATSFFLPLSLCLDAIALSAPDPRAARSGRQQSAGGGASAAAAAAAAAPRDDTVDTLTYVSTGAQQYYRAFFFADKLDDDDDDEDDEADDVDDDDDDDSDHNAADDAK
jgi:hypothetical protein